MRLFLSYSVLLFTLVFSSCSSGIDLDFKVQNNAEYKIQHQAQITNQSSEINLHQDYEINVIDLSDIKARILKSESKIIDLRNDDPIENTKFATDSIEFVEKNPVHCISKDGKLINLELDNHVNAHVRSAVALDTWNSQSDLPKGKMEVGDTQLTEKTEQKGKTIVTEYILNKVQDNIAYLSFKETKMYDSELGKMLSEGGLNNYTIGKLEFDLQKKYYRLIYRETAMDNEQSIKNKIKEDPNHPNLVIQMKTKSTTRITLVE